jgi:hypothetical protein
MRATSASRTDRLIDAQAKLLMDEGGGQLTKESDDEHAVSIQAGMNACGY